MWPQVILGCLNATSINAIRFTISPSNPALPYKVYPAYRPDCALSIYLPYFVYLFFYRKKLSNFSKDDWERAHNYVAKRYMDSSTPRETYFDDVRLQVSVSTSSL